MLIGWGLPWAARVCLLGHHSPIRSIAIRQNVLRATGGDYCTPYISC